MFERPLRRVWAQALVATALIVAGGGAIAGGADLLARSHQGAEQSVCPCCLDDEEGVCCKACPVASLSRPNATLGRFWSRHLGAPRSACPICDGVLCLPHREAYFPQYVRGLCPKKRILHRPTMHQT